MGRSGVVVALVVGAFVLSIAPGPASAQTADEACSQVSPSAMPCVGAQKVVDAVAAECRRAGIPDTACTIPLSQEVTQAQRDAYMSSWVHRAAQLQYALQDQLPLTSAQWIGTHNSFNSVNGDITLSHTDSNQQLSLTQQLDVDVRALELDLHFIPSLSAGGARVPVVCHGRGPDELDLGCTTEQPLTAVLPELASWLNAHPTQVVMLYLEDEMKADAGYAAAVAALKDVLRRPDGSSLIAAPDPAMVSDQGCTQLPPSLSRDQVRAAGGQVFLVGDCVKGWSSLVYGWNDMHVESGSTAKYQAAPACDGTYKPDVYATKLVRYYEDSTWLRTAVDPTIPANDPERLTPAKVAAMSACGVNLFGFDQLLPQDGRIAATIWSWAKDQPDAAAGGCTAMGADGRWGSTPCTRRLQAACRTSMGWRVTRSKVTFAVAPRACRSLGLPFDEPRAGDDNATLRASTKAASVWINQRTPGARRR